MRRLAATVSVALLALAACSGDDDAGDGAADTTETVVTTTQAPATTTTTAASGCEPSAGYEPGTTTHQLTVAGVAREFLVHLPPAPVAAMPLVVDFHGANSDMRQQSIYSGFDPLSDSEVFVVASPNGIDAPIRQWRFLGTRDDVDFAVAVVDDLVAHACVDAARVYATGISSGGAMTASLACQASDRFAGFGPVAANFYFEPVCGDAEPKPMIIFHGTEDAVVPYLGGPVATGAGLNVMPAEASAAQWAGHHGCTPGPTETQVDTEVVELSWSGCAAPIVMYRIVGGGHTWPGAAIAVDRLGPTTAQIRASAAMWEFWSANV